MEGSDTTLNTVPSIMPELWKICADGQPGTRSKRARTRPDLRHYRNGLDVSNLGYAAQLTIMIIKMLVNT